MELTKSSGAGLRFPPLMAAPPLARLVAACVMSVGLAGCPTVDTGEVPVTPGLCRPDKNEFRREGGIWDVAIAPADQTKSCLQAMGCHATQDGRSALRLRAADRASLTDADWDANYDVVTRYLNCSTPSASPFITKPEGGNDPHGGGDLWTCDGSACEPIQTVERWISGG